MKKLKARITAAALAAITAVCGAQALNASAFNWVYPYSLNDQTWCYMNLGRSQRMWQNYSHPEGSYWNQTVKAGTMVGKGFTTSHPSNWPKNQTLYSGIAWVRYLACSHFGFEQNKAAWLELPKTDFTSYSKYRGGDQVFLKQGTSYHAVFVTSCYDNTIYCSELDGSYVKWSVAYTRLSNYKLKRVSDGQTFDIQYVARPIKEGDANGDGIVNASDANWINQHSGNPNTSGCNSNLLLAAADVDGTGGWLSNNDANIIRANMNSDGYMSGDFRYVMGER